ncbi:MAG: oligosaccharide flippase family protein, partial [Polaribacter sp.]
MDALKKIISKKVSFIFKGHERSVRAKKNITALFFIRGYGLLINLLLIPLTLEILDNYKYGVWITVFNVLTWIELFDVGIGNGLRNKFSESIAKGEIKKSKEYVSTAYFVMIIISLILILLFYLPWSYISWDVVFNVRTEFYTEIKYLIGILFSLTAIQFSLKLINTILTADHNPAYSAFILSVSSTIVFLVFLIFKEDLHQSLIGVGFIYTVIPLLIFIIFSLWMFNNKYRSIRPSLQFFRKDKLKDLFSLGGRFFIIQMAGIVIFQTDALIISHVISPIEVTPYNIAFRYFGVIIMFATLIMTPLWSAYTEAYTKKDVNWIKSIIIKQLKGLLFLIPIILLMVFFGKQVIGFWIGNSITISFPLLISFGLYTFFSVLTGILSMVLGGIGKIRLVMYVNIFIMLINIPLSFILIKYVGNKSYGVILATSICLTIAAISSLIQVKYFIFSKNKTPLLD